MNAGQKQNTTMKNTTKLACGVALACAVFQASAQEEETGTVRAQKLNIALTGYVQAEETESGSTVDKVKITSRDIVASLGGERKTQLMLLTPVDFEGDTMVVLRDRSGGSTVDTDVSGAFVGAPVAAVWATKVRNGEERGTEYAIDMFSCVTDDGTFDVQGFTTAKIGSNGAYKSTVNGTGTIGESTSVLKGTISASGGKEESFTFIPDDGEGEGDGEV